MKKINLIIDCPECDETLYRKVLYLNADNEDDINVNIMQFEQSNWYCKECDKTWVTGDFDILDSDEL